MQRVLLLILTLTLTGCGGMSAISESIIRLSDAFGDDDNADPPAELIDLTTAIKIETLWDLTVGEGFGGQSVKLRPKIADSKLVIADREGLIQSRDPSNGDLFWEVETEEPIASGPGVGDNSVLFGTSSAKVIALDSTDGATLWTKQVSSEVLAVPVSAHGVVVIRTIDGHITGLDHTTGEQIWTYDRTVPPLTLRGVGTPLIVDDLVVQGYANGKLLALQIQTGKVKWESSFAKPSGRSELERLVDIDADLSYDDGFIYVASFQGGLAALSAEDGEVYWHREDISSSAGTAVTWRYLYVTDDVSDLWKLDQRNGAGLWKQTELHQRKLTAPVIFKNTVVVGDFEGYIHFLDQEDGHQLDRIQIGDEPITVPPLVVDDVIYVYGKDGELAALSVASETP
ncbi:MAG: outer membrane protein assembly factor BamB [Methylococcales bacterium]